MSINSRGCEVHGRYELPEGYEFAYVPRAAVLKPPPCPREHENGTVITHVASTKGWINALISIYQICAGSVTLYRSRGDQITRYGFAAFGLTVIPYILMTIVNLISRMLARDFPMLYMVRTPEMDESLSRGGWYEGLVAQVEPIQDLNHGSIFESLDVLTIDDVDQGDAFNSCKLSSASKGTSWFAPACGSELPDICIPNCTPFATKPGFDSHHSNGDWDEPFRPGRALTRSSTVIIPLVLLSIVLSIYGALSRFEDGTQASRTQEGFIMAWVVLGSCGAFAGLFLQRFLAYFIDDIRLNHVEGTLVLSAVMFVSFMAYITPAVGGMAMVGMMIKDFGECTRI